MDDFPTTDVSPELLFPKRTWYGGRLYKGSAVRSVGRAAIPLAVGRGGRTNHPIFDWAVRRTVRRTVRFFFDEIDFQLE